MAHTIDPPPRGSSFLKNKNDSQYTIPNFGIEYIAPSSSTKSSLVSKLTRVFSLPSRKGRIPSKGKYDYSISSTKSGHMRAVGTTGFASNASALGSLEEAGFVPKEVSGYRGEFGPVVEIDRLTPVGHRYETVAAQQPFPPSPPSSFTRTRDRKDHKLLPRRLSRNQLTRFKESVTSTESNLRSPVDENSTRSSTESEISGFSHSLKPDLYNDSLEISRCPRTLEGDTDQKGSRYSIVGADDRRIRPVKSWRKPVPQFIEPALPSFTSRRLRSSWKGRPLSAGTFVDGPWNRPGSASWSISDSKTRAATPPSPHVVDPLETPTRSPIFTDPVSTSNTATSSTQRSSSSSSFSILSRSPEYTSRIESFTGNDSSLFPSRSFSSQIEDNATPDDLDALFDDVMGAWEDSLARVKSHTSAQSDLTAEMTDHGHLTAEVRVAKVVAPLQSRYKSGSVKKGVNVRLSSGGRVSSMDLENGMSHDSTASTNTILTPSRPKLVALGTSRRQDTASDNHPRVSTGKRPKIDREQELPPPGSQSTGSRTGIESRFGLPRPAVGRVRDVVEKLEGPSRASPPPKLTTPIRGLGQILDKESSVSSTELTAESKRIMEEARQKRLGSRA